MKEVVVFFVFLIVYLIVLYFIVEIGSIRERRKMINDTYCRIFQTKKQDMTSDEIINLAKEMRAAQKAYFKTRGYAELDQSKKLEKRLDKAIDEYLNPPQPDLFS